MACIVCKCENLYNLESEYKYSSEVFRKLFPNLVVKKCDSCGLVQVSIEDTAENNEKLFRYYQSDYRENAYIPSLDDKNSGLYSRGEFIANMIAQHISDKSLKLTVFEKGCGFGFNLMHVKNKFSNATLYTDEMDEHTKPHLKQIGIRLASWNNGGGGV